MSSNRRTCPFTSAIFPHPGRPGRAAGPGSSAHQRRAGSAVPVVRKHRLWLLFLPIAALAATAWAAAAVPAATVPAAAVPEAAVPVGDEFLVNTFTPGNQFEPAVGSRPGGGFVVAWAAHQFNPDPGPIANAGILAQRFNVTGTPFGGEFQVNTTPETYDFRMFEPSVAQSDNGEFVVTWYRRAYDGIGQYQRGEVKAQRFGADASTIGAEIEVHPDGGSPDVSMAGDGRYAITWRIGTADEQSIVAQSFDTDATPLSAQLAVSDAMEQDNGHPAIASDDSGNFIVVWTRNGSFTSGDEIRGKRFAADGSVLNASFMVHSSPAASQSKEGPDVATAPDGSFVVVWASLGEDGSGFGIFGRRFDNTGTALGPDFQVNTSTTGNQKWPQVAMNPDGSFFVSWENRLPGVSGAIMGQAFGADGLPVGDEFTISQAVPDIVGSSLRGDLAMAGNQIGGYTAAWTDRLFTGQGWETVGRALGTEVFADGFESGNTSAWSLVVP